MGSTLSFLAQGEDTGGRFALIEARTEPPARIHEWEHETLYVLEGEADLYCEGQILTAGAGEIIFCPTGPPHAFYIRSAHLHALVMMRTAGEHARNHGTDSGLGLRGCPSHLTPIHGVDPTMRDAGAGRSSR